MYLSAPSCGTSVCQQLTPNFIQCWIKLTSQLLMLIVIDTHFVLTARLANISLGLLNFIKYHFLWESPRSSTELLVKSRSLLVSDSSSPGDRDAGMMAKGSLPSGQMRPKLPGWSCRSSDFMGPHASDEIPPLKCWLKVQHIPMFHAENILQNSAPKSSKMPNRFCRTAPFLVGNFHRATVVEMVMREVLFRSCWSDGQGAIDLGILGNFRHQKLGFRPTLGF